MNSEVVGVESVATRSTGRQVIEVSGLCISGVEEGVLVAGCHHGVGGDISDHKVEESDGVGGGVGSI